MTECRQRAVPLAELEQSVDAVAAKLSELRTTDLKEIESTEGLIALSKETKSTLNEYLALNLKLITKYRGCGSMQEAHDLRPQREFQRSECQLLIDDINAVLREQRDESVSAIDQFSVVSGTVDDGTNRDAHANKNTGNERRRNNNVSVGDGSSKEYDAQTHVHYSYDDELLESVSVACEHSHKQSENAEALYEYHRDPAYNINNKSRVPPLEAADLSTKPIYTSADARLSSVAAPHAGNLPVSRAPLDLLNRASDGTLPPSFAAVAPIASDTWMDPHKYLPGQTAANKYSSSVHPWPPSCGRFPASGQVYEWTERVNNNNAPEYPPAGMPPPIHVSAPSSLPTARSPYDVAPPIPGCPPSVQPAAPAIDASRRAWSPIPGWPSSAIPAASHANVPSAAPAIHASRCAGPPIPGWPASVPPVVSHASMPPAASAFHAPRHAGPHIPGCPPPGIPVPGHPSYGSYHDAYVPIFDERAQRQDPSQYHYVKEKLYAKSDRPFTGDPTEFHRWAERLSARVKNIVLEPTDILAIIEANTAGKVQKLVQEYVKFDAAEPAIVLQELWSVLYKRYGSSALLCQELDKEVDAFPAIKPGQNERLDSLLRLCRKVLSNMPKAEHLMYYNFRAGLNKFATKLPEHLQYRWRRVGHEAMCHNDYKPPSLYDFTNFLAAHIEELDNAYFEIKPTQFTSTSKTFKTLKTTVETTEKCALHGTSSHQLHDCKKFQKLDFQEKRKIAIENRLCFRCLGPHNQRLCKEEIKCETCGGRHRTVMHSDRGPKSRQPSNASYTLEDDHREQRSDQRSAPRYVQNLCTSVCNDVSRAKSCSKTLLVELQHTTAPGKRLRCYALIDEMSDSSFADPIVAEFFGLTATATEYNLTTMTGIRTPVKGYLVNGLSVRGVNERKAHSLPPVMTHSSIPGSKREVASPAVVAAHKHIAHLSRNFLDIDQDAEILLLLGRDCGDILATRCYGNTFPFAHHTALGWALVGSVCPLNKTDTISRVTLRTVVDHEHLNAEITFPSQGVAVDKTNPFIEFLDDDLPGLSKEDESFTKLLSDTITVNDQGNLAMPIPFKSSNPELPDNRNAVFLRTNNTLNRLRKDPTKLEKCLDAMEKNINARHVEMVPDDETTAVPGRAWWIPVFPVIHHKKGKVRLVFDSSASYHGTSLNSQVLQGPDETNKLRGVLLRFREGEVAFAADIESMFHAFHVPPCDRDWMRFFWFRNNNPEDKLVQFRACVHIFGNRSSPAIANYGLRYTTVHPEAARHPASQRFILNHFYVDDGLGCADNVEEAIQTLHGAREILQRYNIRLHKIVASHPEVLASFPSTERAETISLEQFNETPTQRTLGVAWKVVEDRFVVEANAPNRSFTKRGVLATINSNFDPLGLSAPVVLKGKLIQRSIMPPKVSGNTELSSYDWDDKLPDSHLPQWESWKSSLATNTELAVPRSFTPQGFGFVTRRELHVFADASFDAIGVVMYMRSSNKHGERHVAFVVGASKVAPHAAVTIPRLELCAAVEAVNLTKEVMCELRLKPESLCFYSDSSSVLGYINNTEKRFSRYVTRRISQITSVFPASQWKYVPTKSNPADIASRPHTIDELVNTSWLTGPHFLWSDNDLTAAADVPTAEELPEIISEEVCCHTSVHEPSPSLATVIAKRVSSWTRLLNVAFYVVTFYSNVRSRVMASKSEQSHTIQVEPTPTEVALTVLRGLQREVFGSIISTLENNKELSVDDKLAQLSPFVDESGILRVGGRLRHAKVHYECKFPALLPAKHPATTLVVRHYHSKTRHQGRHLTSSAIRQAGFFVQTGSSVIRSVISQCVTCRKLRGTPLTQKMADLPPDRLEESPPFTNTGIDVFGPYLITDGRTTRRTCSSKKLWGLLFTCLVSRAVHIEPLPGLDTSSFKNALARFFSIRGNCRILRSDRGSNFVGAFNQDDAASLSIEDLTTEARNRNCEWIFNPPHASHFGGVWERKIQSIKRVLDSTLLELGPRTLSRDEMHTLFQEAACIVNNTPLAEVSAHPDDPLPISPSLLLTLKDAPTTPPTDSITSADLQAYGRKRWRRVQYLAEVFWSRWRKEILHGLQRRRKWQRKRACVEVGDLVIVKDKTAKRNYWPCGRVNSVKLSSDGLVRSVSIMIPAKDGKERPRVLDRPVSEIVPLLLE